MGVETPDYLSLGSRGKFTYVSPTSGEAAPSKPEFIEFIDVDDEDS